MRQIESLHCALKERIPIILYFSDTVGAGHLNNRETADVFAAELPITANVSSVVKIHHEYFGAEDCGMFTAVDTETHSRYMMEIQRAFGKPLKEASC